MKVQNTFVFIVAALLPYQAWSVENRAQPNSVVRVSEDHTSIVAQVPNPTKDDIFCDSIELDIVRSGRDYNDFASHAHTYTGPVYISAKTTMDLSAFGTPQALESQGVLGVATANIETGSCRIASFAEYCEYAEKTTEEAQTTAMILRAARSECAGAEAALGRSLKLSDQQIRSVKPIGYLKDLLWMNISQNQVEDLSPLAQLSRLQALDVSSNPVQDLSPVLGILTMQKILANHTRVASIQDPVESLRLRRLVVEAKDTPYSKRN